MGAKKLKPNDNTEELLNKLPSGEQIAKMPSKVDKSSGHDPAVEIKVTAENLEVTENNKNKSVLEACLLDSSGKIILKTHAINITSSGFEFKSLIHIQDSEKNKSYNVQFLNSENLKNLNMLVEVTKSKNNGDNVFRANFVNLSKLSIQKLSEHLAMT